MDSPTSPESFLGSPPLPQLSSTAFYQQRLGDPSSQPNTRLEARGENWTGWLCGGCRRVGLVEWWFEREACCSWEGRRNRRVRDKAKKERANSFVEDWPSRSAVEARFPACCHNGLAWPSSSKSFTSTRVNDEVEETLYGRSRQSRYLEPYQTSCFWKVVQTHRVRACLPTFFLSSRQENEAKDEYLVHRKKLLIWHQRRETSSLIHSSDFQPKLDSPPRLRLERLRQPRSQV